MAGSCLLRDKQSSYRSTLVLWRTAPPGVCLPQLCVHQRVVVEDECLQVHQAPHLRRQAVQLVVAQVQIQQVGQVDEQLVGDGVDAVVTQVQHQHVPAVLQVSGDLRQLVVAQILEERRVRRTHGYSKKKKGCVMIYTPAQKGRPAERCHPGRRSFSSCWLWPPPPAQTMTGFDSSTSQHTPSTLLHHTSLSYPQIW